MTKLIPIPASPRSTDLVDAALDCAALITEAGASTEVVDAVVAMLESVLSGHGPSARTILRSHVRPGKGGRL